MTDRLGPIDVRASALWAAQPVRSRGALALGWQGMPLELIHALAQVKRTAAGVAAVLGLPEHGKAEAIAVAAAHGAAGEIHGQLPPSLPAALSVLRVALQARALRFAGRLEVGRAHPQEAAPVTLELKVAGDDDPLHLAQVALQASLLAVHALAIGGGAAGAVQHTHPEFGARVAARLAERFAALAGHEALVGLHRALRMLAVALHKIANDMRWMGRRTGLGLGPDPGMGLRPDLVLGHSSPSPSTHELGSVVLSGKVNPAEARFELNAYKPLIAHDVLGSLGLLAEAVDSFTTQGVAGLEAQAGHMRTLVERSLMLVNALMPYVGDKGRPQGERPRLARVMAAR